MTDEERAAWKQERLEAIHRLDLRQQLAELLVLIGEDSTERAAATVVPLFERVDARVAKVELALHEIANVQMRHLDMLDRFELLLAELHRDHETLRAAGRARDDLLKELRADVAQIDARVTRIDEHGAEWSHQERAALRDEIAALRQRLDEAAL